MRIQSSLTAGLFGAVFLNVVHEGMRQVVPAAPRVDLIGRQLVAQAFRTQGKSPPRGASQYALAMAGDILSNTLYYSLVGTRRSAPWRGLLLGAVGGWGAVKAPDYLDLPREAVQRHPATKLMTVAWYTLGGLAAGVVARRIGS